ncbi:beta-1,3-galactosyltransferase 1-like [Haliotis asinina]|uniref:beta-1,3-galactosyltransferase 1-like n=1 Tax=Haliotis asinina TaxID=109174 RepID=UPI003531B095
MASMIRLRRLRSMSWRCMLTLLCIMTALVSLLSREFVTVAKDDRAVAITTSTTKTGKPSRQITDPPTTPKTINKHKADITRASKRVHAVSDAMLKFLHITHNKGDVWDNLHLYKFSMNADNCKGRASVVVIVHSAMYNTHKRDKIRKDIRGSDSKREPLLTVVFLVGETTNASLQAKVKRESQKYQDIVQGNFIDSYHNLTHKHIMGYHWVINHCKTVRYVIKIDDDVVVHVDNVLRYLLLNPLPEEHIMCVVLQGSMKRTTGKWAISDQEYPFIRYPRYCAGFAYMTTLSVVKRLYAASSYTKSIWIDDTYATGLLALVTNTKLIRFPNGQYYNGVQKPPARYKTEGMFILYRD